MAKDVLSPEVLREALAICFRDEADFRLVEIGRDGDKERCDAQFTLGDERFYLSVHDEALDDCDDAGRVAETLLGYNMPEVVKSMPDFRVSVTDSGCILGSV